MQAMFAFINSPQDWIVILVIVLLLFGAKKLPELARGVGKSMGEFKKAREDFEREITAAATEVKTTETTPKAPAAKEHSEA
ncbi:MAG: twin-arginine translocase TatA/TatE family subunit [Verrucomicrobiota bacterium]